MQGCNGSSCNVAGVSNRRCLLVNVPSFCLAPEAWFVFYQPFSRTLSRPLRLARPRTPGFHPGDWGSNPQGDAISKSPQFQRVEGFHLARFGTSSNGSSNKSWSITIGADWFKRVLRFAGAFAARPGVVVDSPSLRIDGQSRLR